MGNGLIKSAVYPGSFPCVNHIPHFSLSKGIVDAAFKSFLVEVADQMIAEPFPAPNPFREDYHDRIGKVVRLPEIAVGTMTASETPCAVC